MLDPGSFETSSRVVEELPTERDLSKRLALLKKMNTNVQLRSLERMANKQRPCARFLQLSFGKDTNYEELPKISEVTEPTFEIEADTFRPNAMTDHEPATPSLAPGALEALNADVA
jgi:hypothetical protein